MNPLELLIAMENLLMQERCLQTSRRLDIPGYFVQDGMDLQKHLASWMLWMMKNIQEVLFRCFRMALSLLCVIIGNKKSKALRLGVYLFAIMTFISAIGYSLFPLLNKFFG